ncbi:hypothetical protein BB559_004954 [Furculomyces boomerangus]|uniref:Cyanovirin-N domain-containing protein n=2 Tax=Harpellales TaxID=61421 RepID=A0A2T9YBQ6_9FUNG|nr:hypothetical protein BB559_004954 [Furculomyces boomerangus]PWA01330.1 hypothetical protein BB558_002577 [Smittium angustum]
MIKLLSICAFLFVPVTLGSPADLPIDQSLSSSNDTGRTPRVANWNGNDRNQMYEMITRICGGTKCCLTLSKICVSGSCSDTTIYCKNCRDQGQLQHSMNLINNRLDANRGNRRYKLENCDCYSDAWANSDFWVRNVERFNYWCPEDKWNLPLTHIKH